MKLKDILAGILTLALVSVTGYLWLAPSELKQAPPHPFKIVDGRTLNLQNLRGQPVLVVFWATSCPGCIKEMPHLVALYQDLAPRGLEIIGVAMAYDPPNHVMEMRKRKQIPYPIALDIDGNAALAFGDVRLTPTAFLVDPNGRIVKQKTGVMNMAELRQQIEPMLSNKKQG